MGQLRTSGDDANTALGDDGSIAVPGARYRSPLPTTN
jgi:hypothetical protein